jgi:hypothetical protein
VDRGVGICGSGVGASIAANKVAGVRAGLIDENFSAHQGVEDDDLNMICFGGLVVGHALAWELVQTFLAARFKGAERFRRRWKKWRTRKPNPKQNAMKISPLAGKPAPRRNPRQCAEARHGLLHRRAGSQGAGAARGVWHVGPSRLVVQSGFQRMAHPRDHPGDLPLSQVSKNIVGPLYLGIDTHALSFRPAPPRWRCWRQTELK